MTFFLFVLGIILVAQILTIIAWTLFLKPLLGVGLETFNREIKPAIDASKARQ